MVTEKLFPILFTVLFIAVVIGYILNYKFLGLLKKEHFEKWKELGCPTLFFNNSIKTNVNIFRFLKNKEYLKMGDPQLNRISKFIRHYYISYVIFFGLVVIIFILNIGK